MNLITLDAFRAEARKDAGFRSPVMRLATDPATEVEGQDFTLRYVFSDDSVDRVGDSIDAAGWELDNFERNPVALWAHNSWDPPIGRASNVGAVKKRLMGNITFAVRQFEFADTIYQLARDKFVNAVSVGFSPIEWSFTAEKDRPFGIDFKRQELLEISLCPVPCNPNALNEARAKGIDTRPLMEWAERVLDEGNAVVVPRATLEQIFKDARTPHSARTKYRELLEMKAMADWKCSAARDLPIDTDSTWDGPAAEKSIFDACGFDGDAPDTAKAAKYFLIHDASAPKLKGSYGFPFAKITGGKAEAIAAGIHACASRLPESKYPEEAKTAMQAVIDAYKAKIGDKAWKAAGEGTNTGGSAIVATVSCGKNKDEECLFKDPVNCMTHAPENKSFKAGRKLSPQNRVKLEEASYHHKAAVTHHEAADECIRDVMADDDGNTDPQKARDLTAKNRGKLEEVAYHQEAAAAHQAAAVKCIKDVMEGESGTDDPEDPADDPNNPALHISDANLTPAQRAAAAKKLRAELGLPAN